MAAEEEQWHWDVGNVREPGTREEEMRYIACQGFFEGGRGRTDQSLCGWKNWGVDQCL